MAKQLHAEILVKIPDDPFAAADIYKALQPAWSALLESLKSCGAEYDFKLKEMPGRTTGKMPRRPRKPRLVQPPPEAA